MKLKGKVALVTGASRGIGRAVALMLAREGASVVVNYVSRPDRAEEVVKEIESFGGSGLAVKADVAVLNEVKVLVETVLAKFGRVDILINNAAVHRGARVHELPEEDWDLVLDCGLKGAFNCTKLTIPSMLAQGWGRIVNISSVVGLRGWPGDTAYGSAKAGLLGFTKSLAREVAQKGITVNAVVCGYVETDMTAGIAESQRAKFIPLIPMRRPARPEEIAEVVTFLCCGATYVTGAIIHVDGGMGM